MIKKSHTYLLYGKLKGAFGNYTIQTPEFTELFDFDICDDSLCIDPIKLEKFCKEECDFIDGILVNKKTRRKIKVLSNIWTY